jgi:carboxymethylenebutenolidase
MQRILSGLIMLATAATAGAEQQPAPPAAAAEAAVTVEAVSFRSTDGRSEIRGYLFRPSTVSGRVPAVVMLHGRSGAYSTLANGVYDATTLSSRHRAWGQLWARQGYVALMVDDFGSLGYPQGFERGSYDRRPAELDEVTIRPLHAYGALRFLRSRAEVDPRRIGLMGWSNGGSATLAAMADDKVGDMRVHGFRAGVALYPGCGLRNRFEREGYRAYAPVRVFMGTADEEVSPQVCRDLVQRSRRLRSDVEIVLHPGAEHSFDSPTRSRQGVEANARAREAAEAAILAFFRDQLGG